MDPIGCAFSIANVVSKVVAALANLKDIKQDSLALRTLVRRVGAVVEDASTDLDSGSLSKPGAVSALKGLNETMADCLALVARLAKKSTVTKFFTAGNHVAELRAIMLRLSHDLGAFQTSLGIEQHADLKKVLVDLRADLVDVPLEVLRGFEAIAAKLHEQLGCMREEARVAAAGRVAISSAGASLVEERVAAAVLASLEQAGVVKKGSTDMSAQDVADMTAALEGELKELRQDKQDMEAQYLSQIVAALSLRQAEVDSGRGRFWSAEAEASSMPPDFRCPITMCLMRDPVILETGHSFERQAIQRHLATKNTNPITNLPLTSKTLIDNIGLRNSIQSWLNQLGLTHEQADSLPAQPTVPKKDNEKRDKDGWTPLIRAAKEGRVEVVRELLKAGANKEAATEDGWTPLIWAANNGHVEVVLELVKAGANKEAASKDGWTPLIWAANNGHVEVVRELLKAGANKEAASKGGSTPLSWAAGVGHVEVVLELVKAGANKEAASKGGSTPLIWAAKGGHVEVVRELLKAGANKEAASKGGWTPLIEAAYNRHVEVVRELLKAGANKEAASKDSRTPLSWAARKGYVEVVRELLKAGANKEAADKNGNTPLILAAYYGHVEVVRELLKAGANKEAANKSGKKALDYAGSNEELRTLLRGR